MNIGIIGTGVYSIALMHALSKNKVNRKITMWTHSSELVKEHKKTGKLASIIDAKIPDDVKVTDVLKDVIIDANIIYIVTTSKFFNKIINDIKPFYNNQVICIATKGLDDETNNFLSKTVSNILNIQDVAVLSGPGFAKEIINNKIVALSLGCKNNSLSANISQSLESNNLIIQLTDDIIGIQICNTFKNILAITSGLLNGLESSNSANVFLITKALGELGKIIEKLGGKSETALSLAGIGDIILTCTSSNSRNFSFGMLLSESNMDDINLENLTVEGLNNLNTFNTLLKNNNIEFPLITLLNEIIYNNRDKKTIFSYLEEI